MRGSRVLIVSIFPALPQRIKMPSDDLCQPDRHGIAYLSGNLIIRSVKPVCIRERLRAGCLSQGYCPIGYRMGKPPFCEIGASGCQGIRRSLKIHSAIDIMIAYIPTILVASQLQFRR